MDIWTAPLADAGHELRASTPEPFVHTLALERDAHINGSLESQDCSVTYTRANRRLAVATISRDRESLQAELAMEREVE